VARIAVLASTARRRWRWQTGQPGWRDR
jgi:hypothetical protein